jgi:hypothetical protein
MKPRRVLSVFKFNGMEIEGNVEIIQGQNGGFVIKDLSKENHDAVQEAIDSIEPPVIPTLEKIVVPDNWIDALFSEYPVKDDKDDEDEDEDEEVELIQCNFLAERWLRDYLDKAYREAKAESEGKLLKREFVGQLIGDKFFAEWMEENGI